MTGPKGKPGRNGKDGDPGKPGGTFYQINGKNVSEILIPPSVAGKNILIFGLFSYSTYLSTSRQCPRSNNLWNDFQIFF